MIRLGHRGYSAVYPENTMKAFKEAFNKGFDGVETDVHMTKDGILVLCHDETIDRTSDGHGSIKDMTFDELRMYNYQYKHKGHYDIPTLEELLLFVKETGMYVNIELKTDVIHYEGIEEKVVHLVNSLGIQDQIFYSSFNLESVKMIKRLTGHYSAYLMENHIHKRIEEMKPYDIMAIHPRYNKVTPALMHQMKEEGIKVGVWTVPDQKEKERLESLGVDMIISNEYL